MTSESDAADAEWAMTNREKLLRALEPLSNLGFGVVHIEEWPQAFGNAAVEVQSGDARIRFYVDRSQWFVDVGWKGGLGRWYMLSRILPECDDAELSSVSESADAVVAVFLKHRVLVMQRLHDVTFRQSLPKSPL